MSPCKRTEPFIWKKLNSLHPTMLCVKFGWNWQSDSRKDLFQIVWVYFRYFVIISPWKLSWPFIWTDVNSSNSGMLSAMFGLEWPKGSWEEDFLVCHVFFLFRYYLSLEKGTTFHLNNPIIKGCFMRCLVEIGRLVLEKTAKMWKIYNNDVDNNDDDGQRKKIMKKDHLS